MKTVHTIAQARDALALLPRPIGLVATMGALHEGHLALLVRARAECETVVMSLFVNPSQFAAGEDLAAYPRDPARDAELAAGAGVDVLFAPSHEEMYPAGFSTSVAVAGVSEPLDGKLRGPGHFQGVATVVTKLLNIVGPQVAYFGQKDAQQALVIKRLVRDLDIPTRIEVAATVRDTDGLAFSSRNAYLDDAQRERARSLWRALQATAAAIAAGERDGERALRAARSELAGAGVEPEYLALVDPEQLAPVTRIEGPVLVAVAARVGAARLIDNVIVTPTATSEEIPAVAASSTT